jgi:hypothetical protein
MLVGAVGGVNGSDGIRRDGLLEQADQIAGVGRIAILEQLS